MQHPNLVLEDRQGKAGTDMKCINFVRNAHMVNTTIGQHGFLGDDGTRALVKAIGVCEAPQMKDYVQWRMDKAGPISKPEDANDVMGSLLVINNTCKFNLKPLSCSSY